ncbi:MAG: 50S ribosomal protein L23, partial [Bacilli bacterium]
QLLPGAADALHQPGRQSRDRARPFLEAILRPLITEKSMKGIEKQQKVTVEVDGRANKTQVKLAFEATYKVKVKKVNIVNVRPKYTRRGQYPGTISGFKKAIVTLASGQGLDLFKE